VNCDRSKTRNQRRDCSKIDRLHRQGVEHIHRKGMDNLQDLEKSDGIGDPASNAAPGMTVNHRCNAFPCDPMSAARIKSTARLNIHHGLPSRCSVVATIATRSITAQQIFVMDSEKQGTRTGSIYIGHKNIINKTFASTDTASDISVAKIIAFCRCNTLDSNRVVETSDSHALILNQHFSFGMLLLPKPPQTIHLHLV